MPSPTAYYDKGLTDLFRNTQDIFPTSSKLLVGEDRLNYEKLSQYFDEYGKRVVGYVEKLRNLGPTKYTEQKAAIKDDFEEEFKRLEALKGKLNSRSSSIIGKIFETLGSVVQNTRDALNLIVDLSLKTLSIASLLVTGAIKATSGVLDILIAVGEVAKAAKKMGGQVNELLTGLHQGVAAYAR